MPMPFVPRIATPRRLPAGQMCLQIEPTEAEVLAEVRRMWLASPYWRRQARSLDELLADQWRNRLFRTCARQAWRCRQGLRSP